MSATSDSEAPSRTQEAIDAIRLLNSSEAKVARRLHTTDWSKHPLGPVEQWPQSLRTMVRVMLASRFQMWLGWGEELFFFYNDAYAPTLGLKEARAFGTPFKELWPEIVEALRPRIEAVIKEGKTTWDEALILFLERNGYPEETYHTFSYSPIPDDTAAGKIGGLFCTVTEVTDRVIAERRMLFLRELSAGLAATRNESEVFDVVERCARQRSQDLPFALFYLFDAEEKHAVLARAHGTVAGSALAPKTLPVDSEAVWPAREVLTAAGNLPVPNLADRFAELPHGPWSKPPRDGIVVPIAQQGQAHPAGFLVVGINPFRPFDAAYEGFLQLLAGQIAAGISSARAYEAERKRAEALAEIDRAKTTFFSNVSHELRTPLTLMLGPIEEIANQRTGDGQGNAAELALLAHRNGLRLLRLVNTLLDFSRMEAGRLQARFAPTDLGALTADLASTFRSAIEKAGLRFIVDCPPLQEPAYVDLNLWEKIVLNLISNAYKFTLAGEIAVTMRDKEDSVQLSVRDTGAGIPPAAQARLFERFYRIEGTPGRTQEGTGIGLALVHDLVKLHGGSIRAESAVGVGSTFTVSLRRGCAHLPSDRIAPASMDGSAGSGARPFLEEAMRWNSDDTVESTPAPSAADGGAKRGSRILLVDDNADMRDYVRRLLADTFEVTTAADGEAALDVLRRDPPDLILSDVMMPRLDGFGLVRAVREHPVWRTLPVILLSARAGEEARVEGSAHGADDYVVKPFSARELIARVKTHLELVRVRREAEAQVREIEAQFRLAVEAAEVGTWAWDIAANRVDWSERTRMILGREAEETRRGSGVETFLGRVHPDDRARAAEEVKRTLAGNADYRSELRIVRPDGGVRWIATQGKLLYDATGKPARLIGALIDVTERRTREQKLRDTRARLDATLEAAAVGTWTWDMATNRLFGDASVFKLFSFPHPEDEMAPLDSLLPRIHADDLPRVQESLGRALRGETEAFEEDYRVQQPDGSYRWIASRGRYRTEEGRSEPVMSGVLIDITERKRADEERARLLLQEREAREEAQALGETARALSSDLDLHNTVQKATDAATKLTAAKFGAFFYNLVNERQESYVLYTLSGAPREAFEKFGLPRNTAVFAPTFKGEGVVRMDDVLADPRYGKNAPHRGMPKGHLPVRSYLAVPVISRSGEVLGGMFFGHPDVGVFTARSERVAVGIAAQAAIAIDNAKLYQRVQSTVDRLNFSLASLQLGDWRWDAESDIMRMSPRTIEIFGFPADSCDKREALRAAIHPDDRDRARLAARHSFDTASDYEIEYRVMHPKRGVRWVAVKGRPVFDSNKKVTGMMGVVQDITERKQAELHLRSQRDVLEQIVAGAGLSDVLESLTHWVEEFAERKLIATILLMSEDERHLHAGAGRSAPAEWTRYVDGLEIGPAVGSCGTAAYARQPALASDIATDPKWKNFKDEALRHGLRACWSAPISASDGKVLGTFAIYYPEPTEPTTHEIEIVDVVTRTASIAIERKRAEEALKQSRARLQEHAELLERTVEERTAKLRETVGELEAFSYSISHDMRAPLRSMYGYAELVIKDYGPKLDSEGVQYLKRISKNAARLELLVRDVLAYSKVSKEDVKLTQVELSAFVPWLIGQMPELQRPEIKVTIADKLPAVLAHEAYLSQIFTNLTGNAIKFARPGVPPVIQIGAAIDNGMARLTVTDNGIGIDPAHFSRIFEIFGRIYPDKKFEGTGIGLSIVKKAVQRMGGTIGLESALGKGTTFWFTLRLP